MRLLVLVSLLGTVFCFEDDGKVEIEDKGRRIAGGGNFGGFIGLTTYGAGPFLVKGKFERDTYRDKKDEINFKDDNKNLDPRFVGNIDYAKLLADQSNKESFQGDEKKIDDYNLEYLGYNADHAYCIGEYRNNYYNGNIMQGNNSSSYFDDDVKNRCDKLFGFTGPTANDEPENLFRPCALDDWQCIRNYFSSNSNCKPAYGPIPDPLYVDISTVFYPVVNLTVSLPYLVVRGLSTAKISEFYVNKKSGNLVLALDVTIFNQTTPRAYFRYRRTAKESIVLADFATAEFGPIILTAVIPMAPHLRLDLADVHPEIQNGIQRYLIGPGATNSTDPDVVSAFAQFNVVFPFGVREGLFFQSQLYTSIYIQENICDFGLKIISV